MGSFARPIFVALMLLAAASLSRAAGPAEAQRISAVVSGLAPYGIPTRV